VDKIQVALVLSLFTFASMETLVKLSDNQVKHFSTVIETSQDELATDIDRLKKEIRDLQLLLKNKEDLFNDNNDTLLQLGFHNDSLQSEKLNIKLPAKENYIDIPSNVEIKEIKYGHYNPSGSSWDKVKYVLNKKNRALTARHIIEEIYNHDPELKNVPDEMKKKNETNIFALLSSYSKDGKIVRFKIANSEYQYGFKKWFDEYGEIKKEYLV